MSAGGRESARAREREARDRSAAEGASVARDSLSRALIVGEGSHIDGDGRAATVLRSREGWAVNGPNEEEELAATRGTTVGARASRVRIRHLFFSLALGHAILDIERTNRHGIDQQKYLYTYKYSIYHDVRLLRAEFSSYSNLIPTLIPTFRLAFNLFIDIQKATAISTII